MSAPTVVLPGKDKRPRTVDAVLVVPGIMGSELVDTDGRKRWGLTPSVLATAWLRGEVTGLAVTESERQGNQRLWPTRLLRVPAYAPILGGLEPYTTMLSRLSEVVPHPRALAEFAYDWRLSVDNNATLLVRRAEEHLDRWRKIVAAERLADPREVRLSVVAHSMGGLVTWYAVQQLDLSALLRQVITLGTPFFGAVNAMQMLDTGEGAPVPRRAARTLARTCPGVYDLLPRYRCVDDVRTHATETDAGTAPPPVGLRMLSAADIAAVHGNPHLIREAEQRWPLLRLATSRQSPEGMTVHALVGALQPTGQSIRISDGAVHYLDTLDGVDHGGDSTVYRQAAHPIGVTAFPLPQKHGALAKTPEALTFVADKLVGADTGVPLGTSPVGVHVPDLVAAGTPVTVHVTGTDGDPVGISVRSVDLDTQVPTTWTRVRPGREAAAFTYPGLPPGLFRIEVRAGGFSPVSDILLVMDRS